jgi:C-terminal processing protease CtpA/Prc
MEATQPDVARDVKHRPRMPIARVGSGKPIQSIARALIALGLLAAICTHSNAASADEFREVDCQRAYKMLDAVQREIAEKYYDPAIKGINLAANAETAKARIAKAGSIGEAFAAIAQFTLDLDDSHTVFLPPRQTVETNYGWSMGAVGDAGYVVHVKANSDAARQGMAPGDRIIAVNGLPVTRDSLWRLNYLFNTLRPQPGLHVELVTPKGEARELNVAAEIKQKKQVLSIYDRADMSNMLDEWQKSLRNSKPVLVEVGKQVLIARLRTFDNDESSMREVIRRARGHETLVLDLRGNGGGAVLALQTLLGGLSASDISIGTTRERQNSTPLVAKGFGDDAFNGRVFVLIDARSASAAEICARVVQLANRGTVIGDRSSGMVMESRVSPLTASHGENAIFYGVNITVADLIMSDGSRLEKKGVTPDFEVLPKAEDMASGRDPALAQALKFAGQSLDATAAGALLPRNSGEKDA